MKIKIDIQIGDTKQTYIIGRTNAPPEYDGFGTFTVHTFSGKNPDRLTAMDTKHQYWQCQRNASGMYRTELVENSPATYKLVINKLWERLTRST